MSEPLKKLFSQLQKLDYPDKKISARLRVSPDQRFGLWLDLSNADVKDLLIERHFLQSLANNVDIIEIGQRRKKLLTNVNADQQFKLGDPEFHPWFQTLGIPLHSAVGSFTQPSWLSGDFLTSVVLKWSEGHKKITEFGSGIGQYTVPLLTKNYYVTVFENNPLAISALTINAQNYKSHLKINPKESAISDLYLVNPPRSGLKEFSKTILESGVEKVIYISCSIDSLVSDLEILKRNYQIRDVKLVDQFPHSRHFETCLLLERK